ncbi:MAG: protein kinase [Planctomycetota bacterium]
MPRRQDASPSTREAHAKSIFLDALDVPSNQRFAFINARCAGDSDLEIEVSRLIDAHGEPGTPSVLDLDFGRILATELRSENPASATGLANYRLGKELGAGASAYVYLGEQTRPVCRKVAIKMLRTDAVSNSSLMNRFQFEREALAMMAHPNIAKVLDAGESEQGIPFLVMEYVDGVRISTYCNEKKLTIEERLRLLLDVCSGVQHAHHKGVIHRDIKPSNVLITTIDEEPTAKVIDFGVAKLVGDRDFSFLECTRAGQVIGSPAYMSPEQICCEQNVDLRTDIYALGVLMYEVLSGRHPFVNLEDYPCSFETLSKRILDSQSNSFSAIETLANCEDIANCRQLTPDKLAAKLKKDLNWIVTKCMSTNRNERYASVNELALDIERFLRDEPVLASPPSHLYKATKFIKRNRGLVAAGMLVVLCLVTGLIGTTIGMRMALDQKAVAESEKEQAILEKNRADEFSVILQNTFDNIGREITEKDDSHYRGIVRASLSRAIRRLDENDKIATEVNLEVRFKVAGMLLDIGLADEAEIQYDIAADSAKRLFGDESPAYLSALASLAVVFNRQEKLDEAARVNRTVLEIQERILEPGHIDIAITKNNLAMGKKDSESVLLLESVLQTYPIEVGGVHHTFYSAAQQNLGKILSKLERYDEAIKVLDVLLADQEEHLGESHPRTLLARFHLATTLKKNGELSRCYKTVEKLCEIDARDYSPKIEHLELLSQVQRQLGLNTDAIETAELTLALAKDTDDDKTVEIREFIANCKSGLNEYPPSGTEGARDHE